MAYVGSRGFNLPMFLEVNPGVYTPGQTTRGARLMPAYSLVRPTFSVAQSWFDSLQTSLRLLPTRGFNMLASYTLGKATDHVSGLNIGGESRPVLPVAQGDEASIDAALAAEKGPALFDARHRFVLSFGYELPRLRGQAGGAAGDCRRLAVERHLPGADRLPVLGQLRQRPRHPLPDAAPRRDLRSEQRPEDHRAVVRHELLRRAARWPPPVSGPATPAATACAGPASRAPTCPIFKNFDFAGRHRVQARVEAFNVWNQARFRNPSGTFGTAPFGQITQAEDGRIIQLALKYSF